ncbi:hypothetical protein [Flavobacterium sp. DG2-3]|uniref:hypothetical protein n=1 Tax=Flavobacterium sp. DG2-3 TaxID=3068317 RepID=UPI00273DED1E|nr:hypothetical protein [Flavobacterium sp. DG2-3]MDP5199658.1 hypothetical protein [Flavobacterium sp. DG2-3]
MKNSIILLLIIFTILTGGYFFYSSKAKKTENEYYKPLYVKDLNPKSFITILKKRYDKTAINSVTMSGDFPDNWVKPKDVEYLISIMHSKKKCCGYMNILSSHLSTENAEVGGFAILFLNSYINKTKINLGLNSYPKTDKESIKTIEKWYKTTQK